MFVFRYFILKLRIHSSDSLMQPIRLDASQWLAGELVESRAIDHSLTGQIEVGQPSLIAHDMDEAIGSRKNI